MRAPKGGTVGANGGWYEGGMFLPETGAEFTPKRGKSKAARAAAKAERIAYVERAAAEFAAGYAAACRAAGAQAAELRM